MLSSKCFVSVPPSCRMIEAIQYYKNSPIAEAIKVLMDMSHMRTRMIRLPHFLTREAVYKVMAHDMLRERINKSDIISLVHFNATWSDMFPHVSIPKVRNQVEH